VGAENSGCGRDLGFAVGRTRLTPDRQPRNSATGRDWPAGPGHDLLAASRRRFAGTDGYELPVLQDDLARFAFLLGDDGEPLLTGDQQ
jgi:hypothetical protein